MQLIQIDYLSETEPINVIPVNKISSIDYNQDEYIMYIFHENITYHCQAVMDQDSFNKVIKALSNKSSVLIIPAGEGMDATIKVID